MSDVQAVLFDKIKWDSKSAKAWLKSHGYKPIKRVHVTKQYRRYRIREPIKGSKYATKDIGGGIKLDLIISQKGGSQSKTIDDLGQVGDNSRFNSGIWNWTRTYDFAPYSTDVPISALEVVRQATLPPPRHVTSIYGPELGHGAIESSAVVANSGLSEQPVSALEELKVPQPTPNLSGSGFGVFPSPGSQLLLHGALKLSSAVSNGIKAAKKVLNGGNLGIHTSPPPFIQHGGHVYVPYNQQYIGQRPYAVFH